MKMSVFFFFFEKILKNRLALQLVGRLKFSSVVVPCCFAGVKWVKSGVGSAMLLQHTRDRGRALRKAPTYVCKRITHATSQTLAHHSSNTVRE